MTLQLDQKHENAICWAFEKQHAETIAETLTKLDAPESQNSLYSLYMTYRDEVANRPLRLSMLLIDYNKAKDQPMARRVVAATKSVGIDYEKLQPSFLKRVGRG